jgi:hypothetical protein
MGTSVSASGATGINGKIISRNTVSLPIGRNRRDHSWGSRYTELTFDFGKCLSLAHPAARRPTFIGAD